MFAPIQQSPRSLFAYNYRFRKFGFKLLNIVGHFYHRQFIFKCSSIQITMVMRSGNVSFQGSSRFILLLTDWTIVIAVKVCLNVVPHLRFIFVSS